jgi:hypothetical protein
MFPERLLGRLLLKCQYQGSFVFQKKEDNSSDKSSVANGLVKHETEIKCNEPEYKPETYIFRSNYRESVTFITLTSNTLFSKAYPIEPEKSRETAPAPASPDLGDTGSAAAASFCPSPPLNLLPRRCRRSLPGKARAMAAAAGLSPLASALRSPSAAAVLAGLLGGVVQQLVGDELGWTRNVVGVSFTRGGAPLAAAARSWFVLASGPGRAYGIRGRSRRRRGGAWLLRLPGTVVVWASTY